MAPSSATREGESEPIHIEETDTTFAIGWKGPLRDRKFADSFLEGDGFELAVPREKARYPIGA
jgi:hypothetical protein